MRTPMAAIVLAVAAVLALPAASEAQAQGFPTRAVDGTISTAAGTVPGFAGDGGPATQARLDAPLDTAFLPDGSYVVADTRNHRIRRVAADGVITTVAGSSPGLSGDGGPAASAQFDTPGGVTALGGGAYLVADTANARIRRVSPGGTIVTVAGTTAGFSGDGGPAVLAGLNAPSDTALMPDGGYVIADTGNGRVRRVSPAGVITTIAAGLAGPRDVAVAEDGAVVVADTGNDRILRIAPGGAVTTVAGTEAGFSGDGDPARDARLAAPASIAALTNGGILVADTANHRVRRITPLGAIFTVAGTGRGAGGDGGPSKAAQLSSPVGVTPAPGGGFLVADAGNARIRRVTTFGAVPPAVSGRSVGVAPQAGTVVVRPAGVDTFLALREEDLVPTTSDVDATRGRLEVATATGVGAAQQTAIAREGAFAVRQVGTRSAPTTLLRLPSLTGCGAGARRATAAGRRKPPRTRARGRGGRAGGGRGRPATGSVSAAAIGTEWATTLLCDGTRVTVRDGAVRVRDKIRGRTRIVRAGQSFKVVTRGARRGA